MEPKLLKKVQFFKVPSILGFKTQASWNPKRCLMNRAYRSPEALDPALVDPRNALQFPLANIDRVGGMSEATT